MGCCEAREILGGEDEDVAVVAEAFPYGIFQVHATLPVRLRDYCQVDIASLVSLAASDGAKDDDGFDVLSDDLSRSLGKCCHGVEEGTQRRHGVVSLIDRVDNRPADDLGVHNAKLHPCLECFLDGPEAVPVAD